MEVTLAPVRDLSTRDVMYLLRRSSVMVSVHRGKDTQGCSGTMGDSIEYFVFQSSRGWSVGQQWMLMTISGPFVDLGNHPLISGMELKFYFCPVDAHRQFR